MHTPTTARGRYDQLSKERSCYLDRARECAKYTLPMIMPEEGTTQSTRFVTPYSALPAQAVNTLAAKLLTTLLPPGSPFFKLSMDRMAAEQAAQIPAPPGSGADNLKGLVESQLARTELIASDEVEAISLRPKAYELFRHLIIAGNVVLEENGEDSRVHALDAFVLKRDGLDRLTELIIKECISYDDLTGEQALQCRDFSKTEEEDSELDLYTYASWDYEKSKWVVFQEVNGVELADSRGTYTEDNFPYNALRWSRIDKEDYGRSYVEEYLGDIISLEELTKSVVQGSAVASRIVYLVNPGGFTKPQDLESAENGAYIAGNPEEVKALQSEKAMDLRIASETIRDIQSSLRSAFLMVSSVQRQAERVTAEEIRIMANELEAALGGIYSLLGDEFQKPLVRRLLARLGKQKKIPKLPEETVTIKILTGLDALGRGQDLQRLQVAIAAIPQPLQPELFPYINGTEYLNRVFKAVGLDPTGLLKDPQEVAAEQQQAQQQAMIEKLGPQAIQQAGAMAQTQAQQQPQG